MHITTIETFNLQSHEGLVRITLDEFGLTRFQGDNNDGKSVITKATYAMVSVAIKNPKRRKALINYNCSYAYLKYTRNDGAYLLMHIEKESSKCFYELGVPGREPMRRTFVTGGIQEMVEDFGFHYDKDRDFSLNIYQTYDPLLLVNTTPTTSFDAIQYAITDQRVNQSIESIEKVKAEIKDAKKQSILGLELANRELAGLEFHDLEVEVPRLMKLKSLTTDLKLLARIPVMPKVQRILDISDLIIMEKATNINDSILNIEIVPDHDLNDLEILFAIKRLENPTEEMKEIQANSRALELNICPTCERNFA